SPSSSRSLFPHRVVAFHHHHHLVGSDPQQGQEEEHPRSRAMAGRTNIPTNNSALIAIIADEDTVTGFLMAGVGNVDLRKKTNYLLVDNKTTVKQIEDAFKEFTAREDIAIVLISQYVSEPSHTHAYICVLMIHY
ncbi:unnamed protein product, partial [Urochloa humidicola]